MFLTKSDSLIIGNIAKILGFIMDAIFNFLDKITGGSLIPPKDWKRSFIKMICHPETQKSSGWRFSKTENPPQRFGADSEKPDYLTNLSLIGTVCLFHLP